MTPPVPGAGPEPQYTPSAPGTPFFKGRFKFGEAVFQICCAAHYILILYCLRLER